MGNLGGKFKKNQKCIFGQKEGKKKERTNLFQLGELPLERRDQR